jgi:general secretion pathway protein I
MRKGEHRMIAPLIHLPSVIEPHPSLARRANKRRNVRPALTLLEVVIALAIFLLAMTVFSQMLIRNGEITRDIQRQNLATRLCQSKLAEVVAGVVPLSTQSDAPCEDDPDYTWSMTADNGSVAGLWNVTVVVTRQSADADNPIQASLTEMVLDPSIVGSTQDVPPPAGTNTGSNGTGSSTPSP